MNWLKKETNYIINGAKVTFTDSKNYIKEQRKTTGWTKGMESFKAILWAFVIGIALIILTGQADVIWSFVKNVFTFNFGSSLGFANFLARLSYLIPLGLALAVSFKMGLFNIGASGQSLGGGLAAFLFASTFNVGQFGWIITIIIGIVVGMLIALLIGFLKTKFNINEVISSIMINWIIFYIVKYVSLDEGSIIASNSLQMDWINNLFNSDISSVNLGIFIMIPLPFILWFMYSKTKWGFRQEMIGNNKNVGSYLGINQDREVLKTMALSGAFAGLAGTVYFTGYHLFLPDDGIGDIPGWTFDGITVALLGFNSPIGVIFSASFLAIFQSYSDDLDKIIGDYGIVSIMIATTIIMISASNYRINYGKRKSKTIIWIKNKWAPNKEVKHD